MDLDALEAELERARSKPVIASAPPHVSSYQKADPYHILSFGPPKPPRVPVPRLTSEQRKLMAMARSEVKSEYAVGTIERLEEELLGAGKGQQQDDDDDEGGEAKRAYPKWAIRDVRLRVRNRGYPEEALRKMEDYMEEGWRLQEIINRRNAEQDKKNKKKGGGEGGEGKEGGGGDLWLNLGGADSAEGGSSFGVTPRTPGRPDTAGTKSVLGGEGESTGRSSGASSPKSETARLLATVALDSNMLEMLLGGSDKSDDVRKLPKVDPEKEKEREEAEARARAKAEGRDEGDEETRHSNHDLKALMQMAGVKPSVVQQCFERAELEEILADRLIELHEASLVALKFVRHGLAQVETKRLKEIFAADDKAARDLQKFARHHIYYRHGQQLLSDIRREVRLQDLGADATVLTLLAGAKDGDIIVIPKGNHYVKATRLIKTCETPTDTKMYVESAAQLRPGGDVVVGMEACLIMSIQKGVSVRKGAEGGASVKADEIIVKRNTPAILWELVMSERLKVIRDNDLMKKRSKTKEPIVGAPDPDDLPFLKHKVLKMCAEVTDDMKVGMLEHDWVNLVKEMLGTRRDPEVKSTFRWLAGTSESINFVVTLLNAISETGPEDEALTEDTAKALAEQWWNQQFWSGLVDAQGKELVEIPEKKLSEAYRTDVESVLLGEIRMGEKVGPGSALEYLKWCTFDGLRRGRVVSQERFDAVIEGLHEGCEFVTAHDEDSVVRAEGRVEVRSVVEIVGEPGTVIHGCLALGESMGGVYVRPIPNMPSQVLRLITDEGVEGERIPRELVDKNTNVVMWSRESQGIEYLETLLETCQKLRGSVKGITVRSGNTDALRVEGGEWDVTKCRFACSGSASDALVCGQGGLVHAKRCEIGGIDSARECRNVLSVLERGTIKVTGCLLSCGDVAGVRLAVDSTCVVEKCMIRSCGSALNGCGAPNAKVELMDNKLEQVPRLWADDTHRPLRGQVVELNNMMGGREVVFNDWRRAEWEKEAARLREAMARKAQSEKDEADAKKRNTQREKAAGGGKPRG